MDPSDAGHLTQLRDALMQTLQPDMTTRKAGEAMLAQAERAPGFTMCMLKLMEVNSAPDQRPVRQGAAVYFKNFVKNNWSADDGIGEVAIAAADRDAVKGSIVGLMCHLPSNEQKQLSEALSTIAKYDFPAAWPGLLPSLNEQLGSGNLSIINGVLATANAIFKRFRWVEKTDALYAVLAQCLAEFNAPLLAIFQQLCTLAGSSQDKAQLVLIFSALRLVARIFYSLNWQDIPEFYEDNMAPWMQGFQFFLDNYSNPLLVDEDEEDEPGPVEVLQTAVIENLNLYCDKYEEEFQPHLPGFTQRVWALLTTLNKQAKYDTLATTAIKFLTSIISKEMHKAMFEPAGVLKQICENIVVPNLWAREIDEELFEDNPVEFIRNDIEGSDADTRRRAACNLVRGMLKHFKPQVTALCFEQMNVLLGRYKNPPNDWKAKDACIALVFALVVEAQTKEGGVTQFNAEVPLHPFYMSEILPELNAAQGVNHLPLVRAGTIKFVSTFRNQLATMVDAAHFGSLFQLLAKHLAAESHVVHTYAAQAIERFLHMKAPGAAPAAAGAPRALFFGKEQLKPYLQEVFTSLFDLVDRLLPTENEYVMKAIMRVINVAGSDLVPHAEMVIGRLSAILGRIAANPTNPSFSHFLFESIAALVDAGCRTDPGNVAGFEALLFPSINIVLQQNIDAITPYVYQVLAQLLELRAPAGGIGPAFTGMFTHVLAPVVFERRGDVPAAVRLICAYLSKGPTEQAVASNLSGVLGVFQKLVSSKANEEHGFALINALVSAYGAAPLEQFMNSICVVLLQRSQTNKTIKYSRHMVHFFVMIAACHGGAALSAKMDAIQPGLFLNFFGGSFIPHLPKVCEKGGRSKRAAQVGIVRILCEVPEVAAAPPAFSATLKLAVELCNGEPTAQDDDEEGTGHIELAEEGYTAGYARLVMAKSTVVDPFQEVPPAKAFLVQSLARLAGTGVAVGQMAAAGDGAAERAALLRQWAAAAGVALQL
jgi:exportin-2 (importin alpha re-exporter)